MELDDDENACVANVTSDWGRPIPKAANMELPGRPKNVLRAMCELNAHEGPIDRTLLADRLKQLMPGATDGARKQTLHHGLKKLVDLVYVREEEGNLKLVIEIETARAKAGL